MGVLGAAESYYKKAISCSKHYEFENDIDLSRSLQGLSAVHAERNEYKLARTLAATASNIASKYKLPHAGPMAGIPLSGPKSGRRRRSWRLSSEPSSQLITF
jgi:hypothetical protein